MSETPQTLDQFMRNVRKTTKKKSSAKKAVKAVKAPQVKRRRGKSSSDVDMSVAQSPIKKTRRSRTPKSPRTPRKTTTKRAKAFISLENLPKTITETMVRSFLQLGRLLSASDILEVSNVTDARKRIVWLAGVTTLELAQTAQAKLNGAQVDGNRVRVRALLAKERREKKERKERKDKDAKIIRGKAGVRMKVVLKK
eukprot:gnl/Dysnectes_brevis/1780_a2038_2898.p1 GENE.gnl/Dysnectes_brevis/1780_a2038_2898~~gnl/Dysnectes_brevis/1780_a2038_2898.p1  ORF type:complete len:206 (-),score=56.71 gnl/Dysnectes_brevis/1780_a2038_2898:33-623(-)